MKKNLKLLNKVVLVTGSSRGIGKSIAIEFARCGAKVCVTYNDQKKKAENVCKEINKLGGQSFPFHLDVTNKKNIEATLSEILKKYGKLDILINNAGFLEQKNFFNITEDDWDFVLAINLKSIFLCTQIFSKYFISQNSGSIINISSVGGQIGGDKSVHYATSKAGVISLTKSIARILSPFGIRVNCIAPGFIKTDMYDYMIKKQSEEKIISNILLGRPGLPSEVAKTAIFLGSDDSSYITGHTINVNGGLFF